MRTPVGGQARMNYPPGTILKIGAWRVDPVVGQISREEEAVRVEARSMRLLVCLAERAGDVVSIDELLDQVWSGVIVSPDSVYQAVASLRRLLGDDPKRPTYIATVPRLGYRMVAPVSHWADQATALTGHTPVQNTPGPATANVEPTRPRLRPRAPLVVLAVVALASVLIAAFLSRDRAEGGNHGESPVVDAQVRKSIAVLPFLDLTEGMRNEYLADGMTEELIDKLSKVASLRVPAPTSSLYFKRTESTLVEIARSLGVAYVLDGSVRKSGGRLRVAARLMRADTGLVVWSEAYDRALDDALAVQDDIAREVARALIRVP